MNFNNKKTKKIVAIIALFVVFAMVSSMILPAFV